MAENFNDLLDQTETRAQALSLEADKAIELLDSVDTMLDNLSSTIEESANEAKTSFDTLTEQITTAEDTLQTQQETTRESMNSLMEQVQEAGSRIQESLSNAFNKFGELQTKQQEFLGEVGEELVNVNDGFGELREECSQVMKKLDLESNDFKETGTKFSTSIDDNLQRQQAGNQSLVKNLSDYVGEFKNNFGSIIEENNDLIEQIYETSDNLAEPIQKIFDKSIEPEEENFIRAVKQLNNVVSDSEREILVVGEAEIAAEEKINNTLKISFKEFANTSERLNETKFLLKKSIETLN